MPSIPEDAPPTDISGDPVESDLLHELVCAGEEIVKLARDPGGRSVYQLLDWAENAIFRIGETNARSSFAAIDTLLGQAANQLQGLHRWPKKIKKKKMPGVPDAVHSEQKLRALGLRGGEKMLIAAFDPEKSSTYALHMVEHLAVNKGLPVAYFSMRMSETEVIHRLACVVCGIDPHRLSEGQLRKTERLRAREALDDIRKSPLHICCQTGLTAFNVRAETRRLAGRVGLIHMIVIDSIEGLLSSEGAEDIAAASQAAMRILDLLSNELLCPLLVVTQIPGTPRTHKKDWKQYFKHTAAMGLDRCATGSFIDQTPSRKPPLKPSKT